MRATLKPLSPSPHRQEQVVTMVGRMRRGKIKVQYANGAYRAKDRFLLFSEDGQRRITEAEFNALPWELKSEPDPVKQTAEMFP